MKFLLFFICLGFSSSLCAQKISESFYVFKADWSSAKSLEDATYFMAMEKESDSVYVCRYYTVTGPMVKMETYKDKGLETPHGRFAWYNSKGKCDSTGMVWNGRKDQDWWHYSYDTTLPTLRVHYNRGKVIKTEEVITRKPYSKVQEPDDTRVMVEASFRGGASAWRKYLERNLNTPVRYQNMAPQGTTKGEVIIVFLVDKEGKVDDAYLEKSVEWSVDTEALRLIKYAPKWTPATIDGVPVFYRQKQSITFQVYRE
jgi:TonB family protein